VAGECTATVDEQFARENINYFRTAARAVFLCSTPSILIRLVSLLQQGDLIAYGPNDCQLSLSELRVIELWHRLTTPVGSPFEAQPVTYTQAQREAIPERRPVRPVLPE
jgi:hypothetical protein